jgi:predicted lipid-binding transport protein (Tim44 family)
MTAQATQPQPSLMATCAAASKPQTRILFGMAGTFTVLGTLLGAFTSKWFLLLPALVSVNQLLMAGRGWCPMSLLLTRLNIGSDKARR